MSATTMPRTRRATRGAADAREAASGRTRPPRAGGPRPARRVSGPATGRSRVQPQPQHNVTVAARALAVVRSLPDRSLVDRLVRGRAWIPVLGVLLVGIVAAQVEILKLGTSLGRSLDRTTSLQTQNESLQAGVATLADDQRIERLAAGMGMVMPTPGLLTFVPAQGQGELGRALANIQAPDPTGFVSQLAALVAKAALITPTPTTTAITGSQSSTGQLGTGTTAGTAATGTGTTGTGSAATGTTTSATTTTGTTTTGTTTSATTTTGTTTTGTATTSGTTARTTATQPTAPPTDTGPTQATPPTGTSGGAATGAAVLPSTSQSSATSGG